MNALVQFTLGESGHVGFPVQATGCLSLPKGELLIVECGRNRAHAIERVFEFANFHAQHHQ